MLVSHHVIASVSGGIIIYLLTHILSNAILFCLAGIFIDLDHLFDYVRNWGWKIVSFQDFTKIFYTRRLKKIYVLLHSYELLIIFGLFIWYLKVDWGWVVFLSLTIHLLMDRIFLFTHFKGVSPWFYFLSYRVSKRFEPKKFNIKF